MLVPLLLVVFIVSKDKYNVGDNKEHQFIRSNFNNLDEIRSIANIAKFEMMDIFFKGFFLSMFFFSEKKKEPKKFSAPCIYGSPK
jgi:hypothetical protein